MTTAKYALKKLEREGFRIEQSKFDREGSFNRTFFAYHPDCKYFIEVMTQNGTQDDAGDVVIIDVRHPDHHDDPMTDYHAGTFCDNITQAIRMVKRY